MKQVDNVYQGTIEFTSLNSMSLNIKVLTPNLLIDNSTEKDVKMRASKTVRFNATIQGTHKSQFFSLSTSEFTIKIPCIIISSFLDEQDRQTPEIQKNHFKSLGDVLGSGRYFLFLFLFFSFLFFFFFFFFFFAICYTLNQLNTF